MPGTIIDLQNTALPDNCYVFKHSTRCPVSFAAAAQVRKATFSLPLYWINVVEQRPLSNWFADTYGVTHQSPQLILVKHGKAKEHWSHGAIATTIFTE